VEHRLCYISITVTHISYTIFVLFSYSTKILFCPKTVFRELVLAFSVLSMSYVYENAGPNTSFDFTHCAPHPAMSMLHLNRYILQFVSEISAGPNTSHVLC
jgi:hypothetical protein